ncbi:MAG: pyridoxine 5'-phosphate synthase [Acidobacteriota bacterium]|nr:pyridoxine 5'-phosphate synthase [Acidobacteriota bacterium]
MPRARLSVNVDHVATLRQARGVDYPDPVEAAAIAEAAGAEGITIHIRVDRRHIQERDVRVMRERVAGKLNLEMSTAEEMVDIALETRPHQVTLVPERAEEVTTEGGLDLTTQMDRIREVAQRLAAGGIATSLFIDPDPEHVRILAAEDRSMLPGFEINTDAYTRVSGAEQDGELERVREAALQGADAGLLVYAGHGLTTANVGPISAIEPIEELNIGHSIVSRAVLVGLHAAVGEILEHMYPGT